jgi:hypothetical protein
VTEAEIIERANVMMADEGMTATIAAKRLGVRADWLINRVGGFRREPMSAAEVKVYRANLPEDTRPIGARLLGDPPAWRSALAQRGEQHG